MRGGKRVGQGRKSQWGKNPETKTVRVPARYVETVKKFTASLHQCSESQRLLIWWLTEADCRLIGEPRNREALEVEPFYPNYRYWGYCCIEELPLPEYLKALYCDRYGRPGRGRLWVPPHIPDPVVELPSDGADSEVISASGGLVFLYSDLPLVRLMPGLATDLNGAPVGN